MIKAYAYSCAKITIIEYLMPIKNMSYEGSKISYVNFLKINPTAVTYMLKITHSYHINQLFNNYQREHKQLLNCGGGEH